MKRSKDFENILNECLERLLSGDRTVAQCLEAYPADAAELEPLLRTVLAAHEATDISPRPEFRERARYQFQAAVREMGAGAPRGFFGWLPRWAMVTAGIVAVLLAGSGTVIAAGDALPDSPLYQVKLAREAVQLAMATSPLDKAELYVRLSDERVAEIIAMAEQGESAEVESTALRLNDQLLAMASLDLSDGDTLGGGGAEAFDAAAPAEAPRAMSKSSLEEGAASPDETVAPTAPGTTIPAAPPPEAGEQTVPEPAPEPSPETEDLPLLSVPEIVVPETAAGGGNAVTADGAETGLKDYLANSAASNSIALYEILETVPEPTRTSLLRAIALAEAGYYEALRNVN